METFRVPHTEIDARIAAVQKRLRQEDIDALLIVQRMDLFYFSGTAQSGYLYIPNQGAATLFIRRYLPRAQKESAIQSIMPIASVKALPRQISDIYGGLPAAMGVECDVMPVRDFRFLEKIFAGVRLVDGSDPILATRQVKSSWELAQMEQTAALSAEIFRYIGTAIRPGITEIAFSGQIEAFARSRGHGAGLRVRNYLTEGYAWHILSGSNGGKLGALDSPASGEGTSPAFPCGAGNKRLAAGEPIMIDIATVRNGYHMDETRMFAMRSVPPQAMKAGRAAEEIFEALVTAIRPGMVVHELYDIAVAKAAALGYGDRFLGPQDYQVSFVGHGIGLELVEPPIVARGKTDILEAGMVLALEPKIVFENHFCAGIESVVAVTATGARPLTRIPQEIFIC